MRVDKLNGCHALPVSTSEGEFIACYSEKGLAEISFPGQENVRQQSAPVSAKVRAWHSVTRKAIQAALRGEKPAGTPPMDLSRGTEFQKQVWRALSAIPRGGTSSYGRIAEKIGRPAAVRAVGQACGANPIPVLIPCHRVLTAAAGLGGFSGGLEWKRKLLEREGVSVR